MPPDPAARTDAHHAVAQKLAKVVMPAQSSGCRSLKQQPRCSHHRAGIKPGDVSPSMTSIVLVDAAGRVGSGPCGVGMRTATASGTGSLPESTRLPGHTFHTNRKPSASSCSVTSMARCDPGSRGDAAMAHGSLPANAAWPQRAARHGGWRRGGGPCRYVSCLDCTASRLSPGGRRPGRLRCSWYRAHRGRR